MKQQQIIFTFGMLLLLAGCNNTTKTISRKTIVLENEMHDDFGSLIYQDIDDKVLRATFYDGNTYDYAEVGDTLVLEMSKKTYRKEYKKHTMMYPEEMVIDPDSVLYKKNEIEKNDPVIQAKKKLIREQIQSKPIQIVASKTVRIR